MTDTRANNPPAAATPPRLGSWSWAVFLTGLLGGWIGYFILRDEDRPRAKHVLKWGFIWAAVHMVLLPLLFFGALALIVTSSTNTTNTIASNVPVEPTIPSTQQPTTTGPPLPAEFGYFSTTCSQVECDKALGGGSWPQPERCDIPAASVEHAQAAATLLQSYYYALNEDDAACLQKVVFGELPSVANFTIADMTRINGNGLRVQYAARKIDVHKYVASKWIRQRGQNPTGEMLFELRASYYAPIEAHAYFDLANQSGHWQLRYFRVLPRSQRYR